MQKSENGNTHRETTNAEQHIRKDKNRTQQFKNITEHDIHDKNRKHNKNSGYGTGLGKNEKKEGRNQGRKDGREEGRTGQAPKGKEGMKKGRKAGRWRWTGTMAGREQE